MLASASTISGLGIGGGSSITLTAAERTTGSVYGTGRETPFSFLGSLTSANRLNCLGGSSPGGGAGDHSASGYWKQQQQQQFHNSTSTYPHSVYNGGGGGNGGGSVVGGGGNNSGNQKVNI